MRIGINALFLVPTKGGGSETYLRNLLRALADIDRTNQYLIYANKENAGSWTTLGENFREVRCSVRAGNKPARLVFEQFILPRLAARDRIDVLHCPVHTVPYIPGTACVVTIHDLAPFFCADDWGKAAVQVHRAMLSMAAWRSTRILTVSKTSRHSITKVLGICGEKVDVVYPGIDGNLVATTPEDEASVRHRYNLPDRFLFSVATSVPHKNFAGLIGAYAIAAQSWSNPPPLVIAGIKGTDHSRVEELAKNQNSGRVMHTGWLTEKDLASLYRAAAVFVFASKYEGFGFAVLDAMAAGVPVVCSNAASLPEAVGDAGLLANPDDANAMAEGIVRAMDDTELRRNLIARGAQRASRFTWRAAAIQTVACYAKASTSRRNTNANDSGV